MPKQDIIATVQFTDGITGKKLTSTFGFSWEGSANSSCCEPMDPERFQAVTKFLKGRSLRGDQPAVSSTGTAFLGLILVD